MDAELGLRRGPRSCLGWETTLMCGAGHPFRSLPSMSLAANSLTAFRGRAAGLWSRGGARGTAGGTEARSSPPRRPALPTMVPGPAAPRPRPTFDARHGGDVAPGSTTRAVAGRPETRDGGQTTPGSARRSTSAGGSRSRGGVGGARGRFGARLPPALRGRLRSAGPGLWFPSDPGGGGGGPKSPRSRERRVKSSRRRGRRPCAIASGSARRTHFSPAPASL